ncbi:hypothetical protein E4P39_08985 [Blastococcus sp. CT_GayMR19]|uniref:hypothetical protein n=1 Tax=Blastococcus sp. CT_GayMR19 TaxID=2559608 RepID=UPI0010731099|nr:hypothetical protein [Blastococcus sp. CT_GayMR19]TFV76019.1 hypothetical protein E4P39_08985 [Blastococcus sp. CT_GayMR19]
MADYSEFPTTPTAWQEITPLETEDRPLPQRRVVDWVALIPGLVFIALAITLMTGIELFLFDNGGLVWIALIGGGVALLVSEMRKVRRKQR